MSERNKSPAEEYAIQQITHYKEKADHNKMESIICFRGVMLCTLFAPIFLSLGEGIWLSKVTPSLLSAIAAFCTAWLQLRKPQALWSVYRTAQRKIEKTLIHYQFKIEVFDCDSQDDADKLLVSEVTSISSEAHNIWTKNIPDTASLRTDDSNTNKTIKKT
ncbi:SLATT domain-containing protein [Aeromonas veronii]|uniref:SLATT domain-containing protein n=1 Tax=Aeromonas veronii TaxID=654 RepID=UPI003D191D29